MRSCLEPLEQPWTHVQSIHVVWPLIWLENSQEQYSQTCQANWLSLADHSLHCYNLTGKLFKIWKREKSAVPGDFRRLSYQLLLDVSMARGKRRHEEYGKGQHCSKTGVVWQEEWWSPEKTWTTRTDFILQVHASQIHAVHRLSAGKEDFRQDRIFFQEGKGILG